MSHGVPVSTPAKLDFHTFYNVIDGKLETTTITKQCVNPSTMDLNPPVPISTMEEVDRTVEAAQNAAKVWANVSYSDRQKAVAKFADGLESWKEEFALLLTKEQGKPLIISRGEIAWAVSALRVYSQIPSPDEIVEDTESRRVMTKYTPLGVAVGIVPWNFPMQIAIAKIGPALLAGNALILKPSPFTPYCNLKLAELGLHYFPPGVFQALGGNDALGPWLVTHPGVDKISFTGSTATGKLIAESAAKTLKRVTLELGGNDPAIVCDDVDIKAIAPKLANLALLNSGQVCIAIKRMYIHASIYEELLAEIVREVEKLLVADGMQEGARLGPVQNEMQYKKVNHFLADIKAEGLKVATGGYDSGAGEGYFITPTVVDNPPDDSRIVKEEPFGPVFPVLKWQDEAEVIERANDSPFGLGASVWTRNLEKGERIANQLDAGVVWVNNHMVLQPNLPFGGHKQSGLGAEHGLEGIKSYCNTKAILINKV